MSRTFRKIAHALVKSPREHTPKPERLVQNLNREKGVQTRLDALRVVNTHARELRAEPGVVWAVAQTLTHDEPRIVEGGLNALRNMDDEHAARNAGKVLDVLERFPQGHPDGTRYLHIAALKALAKASPTFLTPRAKAVVPFLSDPRDDVSSQARRILVELGKIHHAPLDELLTHDSRKYGNDDTYLYLALLKTAGAKYNPKKRAREFADWHRKTQLVELGKLTRQIVKLPKK